MTVILPEPQAISDTVVFHTWIVFRDVTVLPSAGSVFQSDVTAPPPLPMVYVNVTAGRALPEPSTKNPSGASNVYVPFSVYSTDVEMISSFQSTPKFVSAIFSSSTPSLLTVILPEPQPISVTVVFHMWMVFSDVTVLPFSGSVFHWLSSPPCEPLPTVKKSVVPTFTLPVM